MDSLLTHIARPQGSGSFPLRAALFHIIHSPYGFYGTCISKINVIGNPYDLWRRQL
jgi:hypothetical protein